MTLKRREKNDRVIDLVSISGISAACVPCATWCVRAGQLPRRRRRRRKGREGGGGGGGKRSTSSLRLVLQQLRSPRRRTKRRPKRVVVGSPRTGRRIDRFARGFKSGQVENTCIMKRCTMARFKKCFVMGKFLQEAERRSRSLRTQTHIFTDYHYWEI